MNGTEEEKLEKDTSAAMVDWSTTGFLTGDPFNSPNTHCVELQDMKDQHNGGSSSSREEEEEAEEEKGKRPKKKKEKESSKAAAAAAAPPPPPPPPPPPSVPYYKLFSFADGHDFLLMFLGATGACVHGVAIPIFFVFFGKLINAFGQYYADPEKMSAEVAKNALYFLYLAIVVLISAWLGKRLPSPMSLKMHPFSSRVYCRVCCCVQSFLMSTGKINVKMLYPSK
jgi:hypothetical protein